jgi:hypothetical protein
MTIVIGIILREKYCTPSAVGLSLMVLYILRNGVLFGDEKTHYKKYNRNYNMHKKRIQDGQLSLYHDRTKQSI